MGQIARQQNFQNSPNLICICVDEIQKGELSGRMYHCYSKEACLFTNAVQVVEMAENLYDQLQFPQASTQMRTFGDDVRKNSHTMEKQLSVEEVQEARGQKGTILLFVQYRQRSTWQGIVRWVEGEREWKFSSELEFLRIMHRAMDYQEAMIEERKLLD